MRVQAVIPTAAITTTTKALTCGLNHPITPRLLMFKGKGGWKGKQKGERKREDRWEWEDRGRGPYCYNVSCTGHLYKY